MGAIGGAVSGLFGGARNNSDFVAQAADIYNPVAQSQVLQGYNNVAGQMGAQNRLVDQFSGQGGFQNQANVFNQQQGLAQALQAQAMGQGPNPAQAALAQNTQANIANQASLMAGQRGASSNVGLMARQAAQQGGALQQQSVGQAATMQAQQQLAAQQQLQAQQAAMQQVAGSQISGLQGAVAQGGNMALQNQANLYGAQGAFNQAQTAATSQQNSANAQMAQTNSNNTAGAIGGIMSGISGGSMKMAGAKGGLVKSEEIVSPKGENPKLAAVAPEHRYPDHLYQLANVYHFAEGGFAPIANESPLKGAHYEAKDKKPGAMEGNQAGESLGDVSNLAYHGGKSNGQVDALVSPGEIRIKKDKVKEVASGEKTIFDVGEKIPGKPKTKGDSPENDTVPKKLNTGDIIIPNSVRQSKDPVKEGNKFLLEALKKGGHIGKENDQFKEALKKAAGSRGKK